MKRMINSSKYVKADGLNSETQYEGMTPEQAKIIDKINSSKSSIANMLIGSYSSKRNVTSAKMKNYYEGIILGAAFVSWQVNIIDVSEFSILTEDM
jgi:hypothetical protein